jgi:hypothetical protein
MFYDDVTYKKNIDTILTVTFFSESKIVYFVYLLVMLWLS